MGEMIGRYDGPIVHPADFLRAWDLGETTGDYSFRLSSGFVIDAQDANHSSWTRYINHSRRRQNCVPYSADELFVFFIASRDIRVGSEVLFDYGDEYWIPRAKNPLKKALVDL